MSGVPERYMSKDCNNSYFLISNVAPRCGGESEIRIGLWVVGERDLDVWIL